MFYPYLLLFKNYVQCHCYCLISEQAMNNARAAMITDMTDATARIFCQSTGFRNLGLWSTYRLPLLVIATSSITCPSDHAHRARPSCSSASNP